MKKLVVKPLVAEAFEPFGDVIQATDQAEIRLINNGTTERFHDLATVDVGSDGGQPLMNIFPGQAFAAPFHIRMLERHPLGSQAFIPLDRRPYLVVVASSDGPDKPGVPVAFLASGQQGVNYAKGIWHHPLISLEAVSEFLVVDRGGSGNNLDEFFFEQDGYVIEQLLC